MDRRLSARKAKARHQVAAGRFCLLIVVAFSLVNQLFLALGVEYHFLISAALPYYLNWTCSRMGLQGAVPILAAVVTVALYGAYIACWALSRRRRVWLTAALGLYGLDTLLLVIFTFTMLENPASCIFEILTHCVCVGVLAMAVRSAGELSRIRQSVRLRCGV